MTAVEIGREMRRQYLRLSDAMREANGEAPKEAETGGAVLREKRVGERSCGGIRFQRCGGGRRVIRRQRRVG